MRIAVLDDYFEKALELADWSPLADRTEVTVFREYLGDNEDKLAEVLGDFDIIVGMRERTRFHKSLLTRLPKLKLLITTGMRNLSFDIEAANSQGVTVCGTRGVGKPANELAVGMMIALMRDIPAQHQSMKAGGWQTHAGNDLAGKTLGILGLGKLGSAMARVANALDMKVIAWSQNMTDEQAREADATRVEKDELFSQADVISVHLILSERTQGIVGSHELALMKPSAFLINTARGPIIDEKALFEALKSRRIAGAALDVYGIEPLPPEDPLRQLDNVLLLPHIGYVTAENFSRMYSDVVEDIVAFLDGEPVRVLTP